MLVSNHILRSSKAGNLCIYVHYCHTSTTTIIVIICKWQYGNRPSLWFVNIICDIVHLYMQVLSLDSSKCSVHVVLTSFKQSSQRLIKLFSDILNDAGIGKRSEEAGSHGWMEEWKCWRETGVCLSEGENIIIFM